MTPPDRSNASHDSLREKAFVRADEIIKWIDGICKHAPNGGKCWQCGQQGIADALESFAREAAEKAWEDPPPWFVRTEELENAREEALEEAALKIERSVNLRGIDSPDVPFINCHLQSRHDAELCRSLISKTTGESQDAGGQK